MAFRPSFFKIEKDPETLKREAIFEGISKDFLLPHDPKNMLSSRYLNGMYKNHENILKAAISKLEGSAAEEMIRTVTSATTDAVQTSALQIGIVGQALVDSGIVDTLHVSDKLVSRSTVIERILEGLINKHIDDAVVRSKLMPLAKLFQAEYNASKQAEAGIKGNGVETKPICLTV